MLHVGSIWGIVAAEPLGHSQLLVLMSMNVC